MHFIRVRAAAKKYSRGTRFGNQRWEIEAFPWDYFLVTRESIRMTEATHISLLRKALTKAELPGGFHREGV